jgi:DNA-binding MltR family transcriptional regulator
VVKRKILPVEHLSKDSQKFFDVLNSEKDLPLILVAASYIDACLASILKRKLKKSSITDQLINIKGPIGTFSARADLCYALGLIQKNLYQDLATIAQLRNEVAHHHLELSFDDQSILELCNKLGYVASLKNGNSDEPLASEEWLKGPRNTFKITAVLISQRLLLIGLGIKDENAV